MDLSPSESLGMKENFKELIQLRVELAKKQSIQNHVLCQNSVSDG